MQAAPDTCAKAKLTPDSKLGFVTQEGRGREGEAKKAKDKTWAVSSCKGAKAKKIKIIYYIYIIYIIYIYYYIYII